MRDETVGLVVTSFLEMDTDYTSGNLEGTYKQYGRQAAEPGTTEEDHSRSSYADCSDVVGFRPRKVLCQAHRSSVLAVTRCTWFLVSAREQCILVVSWWRSQLRNSTYGDRICLCSQ